MVTHTYLPLTCTASAPSGRDTVRALGDGGAWSCLWCSRTVRPVTQTPLILSVDDTPLGLQGLCSAFLSLSPSPLPLPSRSRPERVTLAWQPGAGIYHAAMLSRTWLEGIPFRELASAAGAA